MARSGYAKGANKGHVTEAKERPARPAAKKMVCETYRCGFLKRESERRSLVLLVLAPLFIAADPVLITMMFYQDIFVLVQLNDAFTDTCTHTLTGILLSVFLSLGCFQTLPSRT